MLELIQTDPKRALELAAPFSWRRDLPANISRHFEQRVDGRGDYELAIATQFENNKSRAFRWAQIGGQRYDAFVYGRRLAQRTTANIPLHGISLAGKLALSTDPIRVLELAEAQARWAASGEAADPVCGVSNQPADSRDEQSAGDIGGELAWFCGMDHLSLVQRQWLLGENGGGYSVNAAVGNGSTWTQGRKDVLYMRVNFPDDLTEPLSETSAYSIMDDVNEFYVTGSYNSTWLTTTVTPLLTLPHPKAWYTTLGPGALLSEARAAARKAGYDTASYERDIVSHTSVPEFDWGGLGAVGGKGTWLQSYGAGVTSHELGHNWGLLHANFWNTITDSVYSVIGPGTNIEYGNIFDTMGQASAGNNQFNACFKNILDWLPDTAIHSVATNGLYRIYPFDDALRQNGRAYATRVRKDFRRDYWIEFRRRFTGNAYLQNGVLLNWSPWDESNGGSQLLDTTPETFSRADAAVVIGRTFSDPLADVHITPVARGITPDDAWMDVQVNVGPFPGNWSPTLKVEVDRTNTSPGQLVHLHATASDLDGDLLAYAWTFDDGTFSTTNQPWVSKSWGVSGEHVVRCVVSDMKGGAASANVVVPVGSPTGFRVRGVVLDENDEPIPNVRVDTGLTNVGAVWCYTDSDGVFILPGLGGDVTLEATLYGYTFTNLIFVNPITLTSNIPNANFLATRSLSVGLAISTNTVAEGDATIHQFTLKRLGSTNDDLVVRLFVSGTGSATADLNFSPALGAGTNLVTIPAGTNQVVFNFSAVNDVAVEATEFVNLTLVEDPTVYVIIPRAEARIGILDNDQPAKPSISVSSGISLVHENGADSARFVFSRTGGTNASLPVFYALGGTATAGTDYPTQLGTVIIPAGQVSAAVQFRPLDDKDVEEDETVAVSVLADPAYNIGTASATATIIDDDLLVVTISPSGSPMAEPSTSGRFTVKRDGDQTGALVIYYNVGGSASNGVDFVAPSGSVTIPAGVTSADIFVTPLDDGLMEGDEILTVTLTGNPAYDIGIPSSATLTLRDNEFPPVSIVAPDAAASEPGLEFGQLSISRGGGTATDLMVFLAISGTAAGGIDYVPLDNPVIIPAGSSSVSLAVIPFDDLHVEPDEAVRVFVLPGTNYLIAGNGQAMVTIADDDANNVPAVGFSLAASSAVENENPAISVALSYTSSVPVTVNYLVIGGTATAADYILTAGPMTFEPGELAKPLPLTINNDTAVEANETVRIALYDPDAATHDGVKIHTLTIVDDDTAAVSVGATADASETGLVPGSFRITRTGSTNAALLVNYQITGSASAPSDYASLGTSATIPAGATFVDLPVVPVNDGTVELDETVDLRLISAPSAKLVSPNTASVTIVDDDPNALPIVTITSTNSPYAVEGGGDGAFVFTRSGSTTGALTLYLTVAGSAAGGSDYGVLPAMVTIPVGQSFASLPVTAVNDILIEGEETVLAALTVRDSYRVGFSAMATVIIQDNDQNVRVDASDFDSAEPGVDAGGFTFTRFGTTNTPLQVFFTISGTAGNGVDYVTLSNSFIIPAGSWTATLPITPLDDPLVEGPETATLTLQSNPAYALASPTVGTVTINDDEPMVSIVSGTPTIIEGSPQPGVITVIRGGNPDYEFTARLAVGGMATYGVDYPPFLTNVFFSCSITSIDLFISPTNELVVESSESVTASIVPNPAYSILAPSNTSLTIIDAGTNRGPLVKLTSPKANIVFLLRTNVNLILESELTYVGDTNTPVTLLWTNISGPAPVGFGNTDQTNSTVSFTNGGVYVIRLQADDGWLTNYTDLTVVVDAIDRFTNNLLHWTFDATNGSSVPDVSGSGRHGVVTGPPSWTTNGALGGALSLSGVNNYVREATNSGGGLEGLKQFTLSLWTKAADTNTSRGIFTADTNPASPTLSLTARTGATCGGATNVIEATFATTRGQSRRVSTSNVLSNGWQHLAITWSNGLAPALFINGQPDQPWKGSVALRGVLTNCPQFIVGKGAPDIANTFAGLVDDVRVFPRTLHAAEVAALVATNYGAIVDVPTNFTSPVLIAVTLPGDVIDDGRPVPPGVVSNVWTQVDGPVTISITNATSLASNSVFFTQAGEYIFRLIADDGQVKTYADLPVQVIEPTLVNVFASDGDAAELGPDTGEITFSRVGDTNFTLVVYLALSGTASNSADFPFIPVTNTFTFPAGVESSVFTLTPYLDHRTEGDETFTLTIVSNVTYTIGSSPATVTIHDSPYGMWNIAHFTLEELTLPHVTGETADYEFDGLINFVEYASNRDPKSGETNAPVQVALEIDPSDGLRHITLTYPRRLSPTDVGYEPALSHNLQTWQIGAGVFQEFSAVDDGNGLTETVRTRVIAPWSAATNHFVTVRVWLKSTGP